ncbi:MerC domain-containing protein [Bifidobacterium gallicum]|uniref:Membrane associated protein n=1 Tax=Bifidobacterium gallicum DSM 20093 = LMG 11596 TaxID=561180 RepID=D1NT75_9BIFI|nr:MerC domain-containing protein [Bifidobacterium gallicum]EFA23877.1 hypothetical protein BIFGAL_02987 [Bifidobacterium gallicum DSM 20093 = LMG 11596]KFI59139.1 hypothetical protein BGLCM_0725 [Bifidobacterium gallicum DSM 20093 = LMG 11596]
MTELNNSNDGDELDARRDMHPRDGQEQRPPHASGGSQDAGDVLDDTDAAWAAFMQDHADDLSDISTSRTAKKFSRKADKLEHSAQASHAQKEHKQRMLSVDELPDKDFVGGHTSGPRDFHASSWLDVDQVMDDASPFVPPNPDLHDVHRGRALLWTLLVLGVAAVIIAALLPSWSGIIGLIGAIFVLLGAGGLVAMHHGHDDTKITWDDDGARV